MKGFLEKRGVRLKVRHLIGLTVTGFGIVLLSLGLFAATYRQRVIPFFQSIPPSSPVYVEPYASMVMILGLLGLTMLLIASLLFLPIKVKIILTKD